MGTGVQFWMFQRGTAIFLAFYSLYLFYFLLFRPNFSYHEWQHLFSLPLMQIATLFALICTALHAWMGLWTVVTDYVKPILLRYALEGIILFTLFGYVVWGIFILWGN